MNTHAIRRLLRGAALLAAALLCASLIPGCGAGGKVVPIPPPPTVGYGAFRAFGIGGTEGQDMTGRVDAFGPFVFLDIDQPLTIGTGIVILRATAPGSPTPFEFTKTSAFQVQRQGRAAGAFAGGTNAAGTPVFYEINGAQLLVWTLQGEDLAQTGATPLAAGLTGVDLAVGNDGNVYGLLRDTGNAYTIYRFDRSGAVLQSFAAPAGFAYTAIGVAANGNIYLSTAANGIKRVSSTGALDAGFNTAGYPVTRLKIGTGNGLLYALNEPTYTLRILNPANGQLLDAFQRNSVQIDLPTFTGPTATFTLPVVAAGVDPIGNYYTLADMPIQPQDRKNDYAGGVAIAPAL